MANIEAREPAESKSFNSGPEQAASRMMAAEAYDMKGSGNAMNNLGRPEANGDVMKQFGDLEITGQGNVNSEGQNSAISKKTTAPRT